ncbi:hypothetical protein HNR62_001749 [Oceanisphaera litoralis]|nr:hypothetical protein [Oceanisphaera litoralis]
MDLAPNMFFFKVPFHSRYACFSCHAREGTSSPRRRGRASRAGSTGLTTVPGLLGRMDSRLRGSDERGAGVTKGERGDFYPRHARLSCHAREGTSSPRRRGRVSRAGSTGLTTVPGLLGRMDSRLRGSDEKKRGSDINAVMPAKAGIQGQGARLWAWCPVCRRMDSRLRGSDERGAGVTKGERGDFHPRHARLSCHAREGGHPGQGAPA